MKIPLLIVLPFCTTTLLLSCRKMCDYINEHPVDDYKLCNLKKITTQDGKLGMADTAWFDYDTWGNPVQIKVSFIRTGNPVRRFLYDNQQRLKEFVGAYQPGNGYEYWHYYHYNNQGQIAIDTAYYNIFSDFTGSRPVDYSFYNITHYQYDVQGRIIKALVYNTSGGIETEHLYNYNSSGNLVNESLVYDENLNIHRTNKVWMFIDRDYSINNAMDATKFNSKKLPIVFKKEGNNPELNFLSFTNLSEAQYKCK